MIIRKELKAKAKDQLKGNWALSVILFLLYSAICFLSGYPGDTTLVISVNIIGLLLIGSLEVGMNRYVLKLTDYRLDIKLSDLFSGFDVFFKALFITVLYGLGVFIGTILFIVPGIIIALMFSQSYYILAQNPEKTAIECMKLSTNIMKHHKWELFVLELSFIGWIILGLIPFGLGLLWVMPYYFVTLGNYYVALKESYIN